MPKQTTSIPVSPMANEFGLGIAIERVTINGLLRLAKTDTDPFEEADRSHRHDGYSFFLLEKGTVHAEIDFQQYEIKPSTILFIHPNQVHRTIVSEDIIVSSWSLNDEQLNPAYQPLLEAITPAKPLVLTAESFTLLSEAVSLCLNLFARKDDKLYQAFLHDSCNALVALVISQYLEQATSTDKLSRFDTVTKAFKDLLERRYTTSKRPTDYAQALNLSTPYLNECVKEVTGYSVSYHIQQRIILEAKRLLVHSTKSVKEIATELGYDDYPYFSRLFTKVAGMTALTFRSKNLD